MQTAEVNCFVSQVVHGADIADCPAAGTHKNRVSDGLLTRELHARQQGTIADAGGAKQRTLALDKLVHAEDMSQLRFRHLGVELSALGVIARPTAEQHPSAQCL